MKVFTAVMFGLFLVSPAMAQTPGDQATVILSQMATIGVQTKQLDTTAGAKAKSTEELLKQTDTDLKSREAQSATLGNAVLADVKVWQADLADHDRSVAQQRALADTYNARCGGVVGDANFVAGCDRQKAGLQEWGNKLDAWAGQIQEKKAILKSRVSQIEATDAENAKQRAQLSQDTLAWAAQKKKYLADRDDLGARYNTLLEKLKQLANQYNSCTTEFINNRDNSDELVKHKCGNIQFDGAEISVDTLLKIPPAWRMQ